jgi:hypothetical protein
MLEAGTYHTIRTGSTQAFNTDNDGPVWTYWLEITSGPHRGEFITIQTYKPIGIEALQDAAITIE